jgi:ATP-dependent RNA helicase DeaD
MSDFTQLGVSEDVRRSLSDMGFEEPTPVQARAIPLLLAGRGVVAQALTGTGKTAAFGIPLVQGIDPAANRVQAIVLAPTRELAVQVAEHLGRLGRHRGVRVLAIYGGQPISRQFMALRRGVHAIVATPGRLIDHLQRGTVDLGHVRWLVLDEADQMLQMGFEEDVQYVLERLPEDHVTALFSATMPQPILNIVHKYMRGPEMIHLSKPKALTAPQIKQSFYIVPFPQKFDVLSRVLDAVQPERALVFAATKRMVDDVAERLQARGYSAEGLHGDVSQSMREKLLRGFRDGATDVLVATDVAARGLDIPDVSLIVNFDIPPDPEYYVHRIGRTGRVGKAGEAITFVNPRELREMKAIERVTGARIPRAQVPTAIDTAERETRRAIARLTDVLQKDGWARYRPVAEAMLDEYDALDIAAAAIALSAKARAVVRRPDAAAAPAPDQPSSRPEQRPQRHGPHAGAPRPGSPRPAPRSRDAKRRRYS